MEYFKEFYKIKYYVLIVSLLFGLYAWAAITGTKLTGDDNEVKEERTGRQGHSNFYHK